MEMGSEGQCRLSAGHAYCQPQGIIAVGEAGQGRIAYSTDGGRGFAQTLSVLIPGNASCYATI